jgi:fructosamine-3-kinase
MEAYEAMEIRRFAMSHLEHAIACICQDDMDAVLVLHNRKQSLEMMDSAEQLEYQQMLETLSIQPPRTISSRAATAHMERVFERLRRWDSRRR